MKYILFILLCMNIFEAVSQHFLIPYRKGNQYGFADTTGKVLVEPKYDFVQSYKFSGNENLVYTFNISNKNKPVTDLKKEEVFIGLLDSRNLKEIVAPNYYYSYKFANSQFEQYGSDTWIQSFVEDSDLYYKDYFRFKIDNLILIKKLNEKEEMYYADSTGKVLINKPFKSITIFSEIKGEQYYRLTDFNDLQIIVDNKGTNLLKSSFKKLKCVDYSNGSYKIIAQKDTKFGLIDMKGKELLPFVYDEISKSILASNLSQNNAYSDAKTVFYTLWRATKRTHLNRNLKPIKPNNINDVAAKADMREEGGPTEGVERPADYEDKVYTRVEICDGVNRKNYKYGILKNCKEVVPYEYDYIETKYTKGKNEKFYYLQKNSRYGICDNEGKEIMPLMLKQIDDYNPELNTYTDCIILTDTLNKKGLFHLPTRKFIFPVKYESIQYFETKGGLLVNVVYKNKSTLYDSNFKKYKEYKYKISPLDNRNNTVVLDSLIFFKEKDGLLGLTYGNNKELIPQIYKSIYFTGDQFVVKNKENKYGMRTYSNQLLLEEKFDSLVRVDKSYANSFGKLYFVKVNGKYGVLNDSLKEIIPLEYNSWPIDINDYQGNFSQINFFTIIKDSNLFLGNYENPQLIQFQKNEYFDGGINNISAAREYIRKYSLLFSSKDKMEAKNGLVIFTKDKVLFQSTAKYKHVSFERERISYRGINFPVFYLEWEDGLRYAVDIVSPSGVKFFED